MIDLSNVLGFAAEIAEESGEVLKKYWGKLSNIQAKGAHWDLVTEADQESEDIILERIREKHPDHHILSEESGMHEGDDTDYTWIVDPLDGTTNYTHQYPMVSISIALSYKNTPVMGVVYNPIIGDMFQAGKGIGCTLNGKPTHVSKVETLARGLLATGFAYDRRETEDNNYPEFCHMTNNSQGVRRGGSAALDLAYVAAGKLDGFWERGLKPWDMAAGVVLIREAGGKASSYEGGEFDLDSGRILASNGLIHSQMVEELQKVRAGKTRKYH